MAIYQNPYIGQAISNIARLFAPPSAGDMAAGAQIGLLNAKTQSEQQSSQRLADFYAKAIDPNTPNSVRDAYGVGAGVYGPNQSYYGVDQGNATTLATNAADNARALRQTEMQEQGSLARKKLDPFAVKSGEIVYASPEAQQTYGVGPSISNFYETDTQAAVDREKVAADNARALEERRMQEEGLGARGAADNNRAIQEKLLAPVGPGETRFVPKSIGDMYQLPPEQVGTISVNPGEKVFTPGGQTYEGAPKPLSETEWQAQQNERLRAGGQLTDDDIRRGIMGDIPTEEVLGDDGKPTITYRPDAVGQQPAPKSPLVNIGPNGQQLPNPGEGLVWKQGPDGKVVLDERGAPIAIPFQGGKVFQQQQTQDQKQGARDATAGHSADIVEQDIDRALAKVGFGTAGIVGAGLEGVPFVGQGSTDLSALLDTIGANISFDKLQAMREASPTGGALGQVSDFENRLLMGVHGSLKQSQSPEQLKENLLRLRDTYRYVILRQGSPPPGIPELSPDGQPIGSPAGAPAQAAPAAPAQAGALPDFNQMDAATLRSWVQGNSAAIKSMSDEQFQQFRARAQQLQGAQ